MEDGRGGRGMAGGSEVQASRLLAEKDSAHAAISREGASTSARQWIVNSTGCMDRFGLTMVVLYLLQG